MHGIEQKLAHDVNCGAVRYEAPAVESILTSRELEREVAYAGTNNQVSCIPTVYSQAP